MERSDSSGLGRRVVTSRRLSNDAALVIAGLVALTACNGTGTDFEGAIDSSEVTSLPSDSSVVTLLPSEEAVDADVPEDYLGAVLADVAARTGAELDDLMVLDASAVEWADQRLGCVHVEEADRPEPVDGYRVVIDTGEAQFDYRLDASGTLNLCGGPVDAQDDGHDGDHAGGDDEHHEAPEESS